MAIEGTKIMVKVAEQLNNTQSSADSLDPVVVLKKQPRILDNNELLARQLTTEKPKHEENKVCSFRANP